MRLAFAFLADAATFSPDGKVNVLGGDFDTVWVPEFPAMHLGSVLVVKLLVQPSECNREHRLRVEFVDSDGAKVIPTLETVFVPQPREDQPHRPVGMGMSLLLQRLPLPRSGDYAFSILVDDLEMGVVSIAALQFLPKRSSTEESQGER